jgi:hypothetical protein
MNQAIVFWSERSRHAASVAPAYQGNSRSVVTAKAENILANIRGLEATATYDHELMLVIEADGADSMFVRKDLWTDEPAVIKQGRFWGWAKRGQEHYWKTRHA